MASFLLGMKDEEFLIEFLSSHLFQRVASFLHKQMLEKFKGALKEFSSLSESGFIPTIYGRNSNQFG